MALPCGTTGSLYPSFLPVRLVCLAVKRPYAIALNARLPSVLRAPLKASVTLLEATTPVKLPAKHGPRSPRVRPRTIEGWYFKGDSARTGARASLSPTYPTHQVFKVNVKL